MKRKLFLLASLGMFSACSDSKKNDAYKKPGDPSFGVIPSTFKSTGDQGTVKQRVKDFDNLVSGARQNFGIDNSNSNNHFNNGSVMAFTSDLLSNQAMNSENPLGALTQTKNALNNISGKSNLNCDEALNAVQDIYQTATMSLQSSFQQIELMSQQNAPGVRKLDSTDMWAIAFEQDMPQEKVQQGLSGTVGVYAGANETSVAMMMKAAISIDGSKMPQAKPGTGNLNITSESLADLEKKSASTSFGIDGAFTGIQGEDGAQHSLSGSLNQKVDISAGELPYAEETAKLNINTDGKNAVVDMAMKLSKIDADKVHFSFDINMNGKAGVLAFDVLREYGCAIKNVTNTLQPIQDETQPDTVIKK